MNKILVLIALFIITNEAFGACSSPISRTNNSANAVLTSSKYNTDLNTVYNKVNELDGDCISDTSIPTAKYENGSVTVAKLATGYKDDTVLAKTSTYTVLSTDEFITGDATSGSITLNLPTAIGISGRKIKFKKIDSSANTLILDGNGSQTIDGATTLTISIQYDGVEIVSNGANWLVLKPGYINHEVTVDTGNGHGSTDTAIRRFTNIRTNSGTAITYADSATLGGTFTINSSGTYAISYSDRRTAASEQMGITVNDTARTSAISTPLTYAQGLRAISATASGLAGDVAWTGHLVAGDVVRAHTSLNMNNTDSQTMFTIKKISP